MKVGTCQKCRREHPLDDGRHLAAHQRYPGSAVEHQCTGAGKLSMEARESNAAKSRAQTIARIDRMRGDAEVAHDAVATGRPFPAHMIIALCAAALHEYRLKFPSVKDKRKRQLWFVVPRGSKRARRRLWARDTGDVYCTLCRELLLSDVSCRGGHDHRTGEHTTLCALRRLAKLAEYVAPPELRLPADAIPEPLEAT